jgi:hypothetical protein
LKLSTWAFLDRFARRNEDELHVMLVSPSIQRLADELRAIVDAAKRRIAARRGHGVEHADDPPRRQRVIESAPSVLAAQRAASSARMRTFENARYVGQCSLSSMQKRVCPADTAK